MDVPANDNNYQSEQSDVTADEENTAGQRSDSDEQKQTDDEERNVTDDSVRKTDDNEDEGVQDLNVADDDKFEGESPKDERDGTPGDVTTDESEEKDNNVRETERNVEHEQEFKKSEEKSEENTVVMSNENYTSKQNETMYKKENTKTESKQRNDDKRNNYNYTKKENNKAKKKRAASANSMSSLRSSVRPKSSKQPWGTIMQPEFGLGYQKMTEYEIAQTVDRLYKVPTPKERVYERPGKKLDQDDFDEMMQRMTKIDTQKIPDSDRRVQSSIYGRMGVVSSYAWKGYN